MRLPLAIALACTLAAAPAAAHAAELPPGAAKSVVVDECPPEADGAVCAHVDVPLDRRKPGKGTIPIAFELYPHTEAGPATSAILFNFGGPGVSTTAFRDVRSAYAPLRDRHDLLFIDSRGTGRSALIDCPALQHGDGPSLIALVAGCAAQLGERAGSYSTADTAHDYDAVRAALGYRKVDFVGGSYGGVNANAYATRYGDRLRTVVLNGGVEPSMDPFLRGSDGVGNILERVGTVCERSRNCGRSAGAAIDAVRRLVRRVRSAPVRGTALDAHGGEHDVTIDPGNLLVHLLDNTDGFSITHGEIAAATEALERGDAKPLLRLAAEGDFPIVGDAGEGAFYSAGANAAAFCLDNPWPWSAAAPLGTRKAQWAAAVQSAPDAPFAPFRAEEIMFSLYGMADFCLPWPETGSRLAVAPGARYPDVPALVLDGEFDANVGRAEVTAARYPDATLVRFKGVNHTPLEWSSCAFGITLEFIANRQVRDTGCARTPLYDSPGVRSFPRRLAESPAARRARGNRADLRLARVGADAAIDAFKRGFLNVVTGGDGRAPGLRGGTIAVEAGESWTATLEDIRWTEDVTVSGTLRWSFEGGPLDADLQVDGPGGRDGTLHLEGGWLIHGARRWIELTGTLGGKRVVARVPSS